MKCEECVLKHLSAALSFGKEIISGHDENNELDHRIDFLGEITNAEQHLELIDKELFDDISSFRKNIQSKDVHVDVDDLTYIRTLYRKVELVKNKEPFTITYNEYSSPLDVVYINVKNIDYFDLSYNLLKKNLINYGKIYVVNSDIETSKYDVIKIDEDIFEFMKRSDLSENVIFMNENMTFINTFDAKKIFPTYLTTNRSSIDIIKEMPRRGGRVFNFEDVKPQPINVKKWNEVINQNYVNFTSIYFNLIDDKKVNDNFATVEVIKPVCCSVKQALKTKKFIRWNEEGFNSLKSYLKV